MTEILMIRHGQSVWNAEGRWQGQADPALSQLGRDQADAAGQYLAKQAEELAFDGVASSTLDRAATTGSIIAAHLGFDDVYKCADLVERNAGEWSGLTRAQIDQRYPGFLRAKKYPPGYERDDDLMARIRRGLTELIENMPGRRLVVVAHGGIIYRIESSLGLPFRHMQNLGARSLSFDGESFELGERYDLLADFDGEHTTPTAI